jgi:hypothetical protein
MFETPTLITMTIAATRMHRSLIDFASKTSEVYDSPLRFSFLFLLSVADVVLGYMRFLNWTAVS